MSMDLGKPKECMLVCVTEQRPSERLIYAGRALANEYNLPLHVVSVLPRDMAGEKNGEVLEYLYTCAKNVDAEMTVFYGDDALSTLISCARRMRAVRILVGARSEFVRNLSAALPDICFHVVEEAAHARGAHRRGRLAAQPG